MPVVLDAAVPAELTEQSTPQSPPPTDGGQPASSAQTEKEIVSYVTNWRNQLQSARTTKRDVWDQCWQLYRGLEDFSNKEDWQSQIVLPKAWASVKQATSAVKRLLAVARKPWQIESVNPEDMVTVLRSGQMTDLTQLFLENAKYQDAFSEALECSFIIGLGVMKCWWGLQPRVRIRVEETPIQLGALTPAGPPTAPPEAGGGELGLEQLLPELSGILNEQPVGGDALLAGTPTAMPESLPLGQGPYDFSRQLQDLYPTQLPMEALSPSGWAGEMMAPPAPQPTEKRVLREEVLEGKLFVRAVDPYNFYWLPGSKLNDWVGTIEEIEVPKWHLIELADMGVFPADRIEKIKPMRIQESEKQSSLRFNEPTQNTNGPSEDTGVVKITEFYGPIVQRGRIVERHAHVLIANDDVCLFENGFRPDQRWSRKSPYIGFSPLSLPFRTEGVGLIEMDRALNKALSNLANLSMDTLLFRLLPVFEINMEAFDNPEEFETGLAPGKLFKRNMTMGQEGIKPIEFQDVSGGTIQVAAWLDREHQGASMVSEIQQSMPRYRGVQTATEIQEKSDNQDSFFGAMASDIEQQALAPLVEMAIENLLQFLDTANDPRVASILGIGADVLRGLTREEIVEIINGDYKIKVTGISSQLQKAEMLQALVQFMNLIGQNPEAWLPYINQSVLLQRILEAFRPAIHDIENIVADPQTAMAREAAAGNKAITPELLALIPQLIQQAQQQQQMQQQAAMQQQQMVGDMAMQQQEMAMRQAEMQNQQQIAKQQAAAAVKRPAAKSK